jgi:hypothetical protein
MVGALAFLYACGPALVATTLLFSSQRGTNEVALLLLCAVGLGVAALLAYARDRMSVVAIQAAVAAGTLMIGGCIVVGGRLGEAYPMLYVWVALFSWFFFTPRAAVVQTLLLAVTAPVALALQPEADISGPLALMTLGTLSVGGFLIGRLTAAVRAQAEDLAAVSRMAAGLSDFGASAHAATEGARNATRADVAIFLEPLDGDGALGVVAVAGGSDAGLVFAGEGARRALESAYRTGDRTVIDVDQRRRFGARLVGVAQPVLRDGRAAGVLALAWTRPRRRLGSRVVDPAVLFAAQAAVFMDRADERRQDRERQALEINDNIVQGLVVAKYCTQRGDVDRALEAIDQTLDRARRLISDQLSAVSSRPGGLRPGDLARAEASSVAQSPRGPSEG